MGKLAIEDLAPWARNPREITDAARDGLQASVERWGDVAGITYNSRTGTLVAGHQRVEVLRALGAQMVDGALQIASGNRFPVRVVDWSEAEQAAANVEANNPHVAGEYTETLDDLLAEIRGSMGDESFETLRLDALLEDAAKAVAPEPEQDEVPEPPAEPVTKLGDVWTLGGHTLVCGDSARGIAAQADMVLTDPPYGVSYVGKTEEALTIANDAMSASELSSFVGKIFEQCFAACRDGAYWYATVPAGPLHLVFTECLSRLGVLRQVLVWVKDSLVLGHAEYHYRHEPILFGWKPGERHRNEDRTRTSVFEVARPKASREHPTMKPVELWSRLMNDGSRKGETVLDPFAGSGTTLIAAEQLDRVCHAIEIEPRYCDVIVERWEQLTGGKATRKSA